MDVHYIGCVWFGDCHNFCDNASERKVMEPLVTFQVTVPYLAAGIMLVLLVVYLIKSFLP